MKTSKTSFKRCYFNSKLANLILFPGYSAITLFGFSFFKREETRYTKRSINHECIHQIQQLETYILGVFIGAMLIGVFVQLFTFHWWWFLLLLAFTLLFYYIWYVVEWIISFPFNKFNGNDSYHTIAFEEECYYNDFDIEYLEKRKPFTWLTYLGNVRRK